MTSFRQIQVSSCAFVRDGLPGPVSGPGVDVTEWWDKQTAEFKAANARLVTAAYVPQGGVGENNTENRGDETEDDGGASKGAAKKSK